MQQFKDMLEWHKSFQNFFTGQNKNQHFDSKQFQQFFESNQFEQLFNQDFWNGLNNGKKDKPSIPVNLYETEHEVLCIANIPGLKDVNDVDLFIHYNELEIRGNINLSYRGFELKNAEIQQGDFERKILLPFPVKEERINAKYQHGLLIIHLHRLIPDHQRKHKVPIRNKDE